MGWPLHCTPFIKIFGVTVRVAVWAKSVGLSAVKDTTSPLPLPDRPMIGFVFVQLNVLFTMLPSKNTTAVDVLAHSVWSLTASMVGSGLTKILNNWFKPWQVRPLLVCKIDTLISAFCWMVSLFVATKLGMFPTPLAGSPMSVLLLVQLYCAFWTLLVNAIGTELIFEHNTWSLTALITGIGLTVISKVSATPEQVTPALL